MTAAVPLTPPVLPTSVQVRGNFDALISQWKRPDFYKAECFSVDVANKNLPQPFNFRILVLDCMSSTLANESVYFRAADTFNVKSSTRLLTTNVKDLPLVPVIRLFGVASTQLCRHGVAYARMEMNTNPISICCNVYGYEYHFYALPKLPFQLFSDEALPITIEELKYHLHEKLSSVVLQRCDLNAFLLQNFLSNLVQQTVVHIETTKLSQLQYKIDGLDLTRLTTIQNSSEDVVNYASPVILKVYVSIPELFEVVVDVFKSLTIPCQFKVYEDKLCNTSRFCKEMKIFTGCWITLVGAKYFLRKCLDGNERADNECESTCQVELDVCYKDLKVDGVDWKLAIPRIRILSVDIEALIRRKIEKGHIIQVGLILATYDHMGFALGKESIKKALLVIGSCDQIDDTTSIIQFCDHVNPENVNESNTMSAKMELLLCLRKLIIATDPDILTGFHITKYDIPHLLSQAKQCQEKFIDDNIKLFAYLGRLNNCPIIVKNVAPESRIIVDEDTTINFQGRIVIDMRSMVIRHHTPPTVNGITTNFSFSLADAAHRLLGQEFQNGNLIMDQMKIFHERDSQGRSDIGRYCVQDALIPIHLMNCLLPTEINKRRYNLLSFYIIKSVDSKEIIRHLVNKKGIYAKKTLMPTLR